MPITQSAKKALRQSVRRNKRNVSKKEAYRVVLKNIKKLTESGETKDAAKLLPALYKALDKAAKAHVIAKNKAGRLKSRVTKLVTKTEKK